MRSVFYVAVLGVRVWSAEAMLRGDEPVAPALVAAAERIANRFVADNKHERNYRFDLALEALLEMSEATGKPAYREHVFKIIERRGWTAKTDVSFQEQSFTCLTHALYLQTRDRDWLTVFLAQSERCLAEQKRSPEGAVTHFRGRERGGGYAMLIDAMQEHVARMARAGRHTGETKFYAEAAKQVALYRDVVRDPHTNLWHQGRGWIKDRPELVSPGVWSRGHGWLLRGLSTACTEIPRDRPEYVALQRVFEELGEALLKRQQPSGMWHCLLDKSPAETPAESSGTAMIATAFSKAYRAGVVTDVRYRDAAVRAFRALPTYVDADGRVLSTSPGPGPLESEANYFTKSFPSGNDHGTFAVMYAAAEAVRLDKHRRENPARTPRDGGS